MTGFRKETFRMQIKKQFRDGLLAGATLALCACAQPDVRAEAPPAAVPESFWIAPSVSPEARAEMLKLLALVSMAGPKTEIPQTPEAWAEDHQKVEVMTLAFIQPLIDTLSPEVSEITLGGVPALKVVAKGGATKPGALVYVHGGGFTNLSARSSLDGAALMAAKSGYTVYSVDYTAAPAAKWDTITDQVIAAYSQVLADGVPASGIGMFGDSAGGAIVAGSLLKLRDQGGQLPAAVLLQSPVSDLTASGETFRTLAAFEPALDVDYALARIAQYAPAEAQKNPYVSPVYGAYSGAFPPVLIQCGTREILLSDSVRLYQAILAGGGYAVLDVYEGMPHVFQALLAGTPESDVAYVRAAAFWDEHLNQP
jgi:epsilon-lactone hydrolase